MPKVKLFQFEGGESTIEVDSQLVEGKVNQDLLFRAVQSYRVNQRQGTRAAKTRGEVAGSGKKPWPQKHTGRARHGSSQSPIWTGGGVSHGPLPAQFEYRLPKKMKKLALLSAIRDRYQSERVALIDRLAFEAPKTKEALTVLERIGLPQGEKVLILLSQDENGFRVRKSFNNLEGVSCSPAMGVHPYEILDHDWLLITSGALAELTARVN